MSTRPASSTPLREFLRSACTPELLRSIASADYGRGEDDIFNEFNTNLQTGEYTWSREGNPYECRLLHLSTESDNAPLETLFAAWWIGEYCSDTEDNWVLIDNLEISGIGYLLSSMTHACAHLGPSAKRAAHAALPFIAHVKTRDPHPDGAVYEQATRDLESI